MMGEKVRRKYSGGDCQFNVKPFSMKYESIEMGDFLAMVGLFVSAQRSGSLYRIIENKEHLSVFPKQIILVAAIQTLSLDAAWRWRGATIHL